MDSLELSKALSSLPLTALLVLVLVGGYTGWWIYGSIHRSQVEDLTKQVEEQTERADKWEARFLELNGKLDAMLRETSRLSHSVSGTATLAEGKFTSVEQQLEIMEAELADIRSRGHQKRAGDKEG